MKLFGLALALAAVSFAVSPVPADLFCPNSCMEAHANCLSLCNGCPSFPSNCEYQPASGCYSIECNCRPDLC
jgi:hypothetical protein